MNSAVLRFVVEDAGFEIPTAMIKSFKLFATIFSSYPYGELTLDDSQGRLLANLYLKPGNTIRIIASPQSFNDQGVPVIDETKAVIIQSLRVVSVENLGNSSAQTRGLLSSLGGEILVKVTHPWELLANYANRSYRKKNSRIIREILQDPTRGFLFEANQIKIDESDDVGNIVRYKLGESEASFIQKKILPYVTINGEPSYAFINERGEFHLHNFKNMFNKAVKAVLVPPTTEGFAGLTLTEEERKLAQQQIIDGAWGIGRKFTQQLGNFKKTIYVEAPEAKVTFGAEMWYMPSIPGKVLINKSYLQAIASGVSTVNILPFREFEDAVRLDVNSNSVMDEFFQIEIVTTLSLDVVNIGEPIKLKLAGAESRVDHWASGTWLVTRATHFSNDGNYYTKLALAKPAMDDTTVWPGTVDPSTLYAGSTGSDAEAALEAVAAGRQ